MAVSIGPTTSPAPFCPAGAAPSTGSAAASCTGSTTVVPEGAGRFAHGAHAGNPV